MYDVRQSCNIDGSNYRNIVHLTSYIEHCIYARGNIERTYFRPAA
jgi:hypothetical protein